MKVLRNYWNRWLNKRIPEATQHHLNHRNIFILPAKFGLAFLFLCLLLFLLGTNYQNNLMLLLCYFLLALFLVNLLASYINFARIDLQIGKCPEVFVGDDLNIPLWLNANNNDVFPTKGLLNFTFQIDKHQFNRKTKTQRNQPNTQVDADVFSNPINLSQECQKRGKLVLARVTVECFYPLGFYRCWTHLAFIHDVTVLPKPIPCEIQLHVSDYNIAKKDGQLISEQSGHDDFSHLKAFQLGEPLNHVAWKQLAKGRGMVSKQFSSVSHHIGWLKLSSEYKNQTPSRPKAELGKSDKTNLDKELGELCYQVIELSRTQRTFGLDLGAQCISPNSGAEHRRTCLHALAYFPDGEQ
jgi:uncharacterized protein (DUF58 family)